MRNASIRDILTGLEAGGHVEFIWCICTPYLVLPDGTRRIVDGRSYRGFLRKHAGRMAKEETGSTETRNLVIRWHGRKSFLRR